MKEELQGKLVEILTSMQVAVGKAGDFAAEQLPDIAQSYVLYGRLTNTVMAVLCALIFVGAWYAIIRFERDSKDKFSSGMGYMLGGTVSSIPAIGAFAFTQSAMLAWVAPKVWLLKEIAGLLK